MQIPFAQAALLSDRDFFWPKFVEIYRQSFVALKENPTAWILFFSIGFFDFAALIALYLAPSEPFSTVLAPIIRTFWDDRFLHYPDNFLLLPKLYNHAHFVILTVIGVAISGMVIQKIEAHDQDKHLSTLSAAASVFKKYLSILTIWLLFYITFLFTLKNVFLILPSHTGIQLAAGFLMGLALQSFFAFLLPSILLSDKGFFRDVSSGFMLGCQHFFLTSLVLAPPIAMMVALSFFKALSPLLISIKPELVLVLLSIGIIISLIADLWITACSTVLYLKVRNES